MYSPEGICPRCRLHYFGHALNIPRNQLCIKCGSALEIRKGSVTIRPPSSSLKAEEYKVGANPDNWEDLRDKDLLFYITRN